MLLVLCPSYVGSQEPPPSTLNSITHENDKTEQTKKHPGKQEDFTNPGPVITNSPGTNSTEKTDTKQDERQDSSSNEWWIMSATVWLAVVTTFLAVFTGYLWDATRKLASSAEETAKRQLRAFIFGKGFNQGINTWNGSIKEYIFWVTWENVGITPGTDVCNWFNIQTCPVSEIDKINFHPSSERRQTVMGPRATAQTSFVAVPLEKMMRCWKKEIAILIWSRIEYRDIFDSTIIHHHEQCASIDFIHDPSDIPPEGHPPYINFVIYGNQNSTG